MMAHIQSLELEEIQMASWAIISCTSINLLRLVKDLLYPVQLVRDKKGKVIFQSAVLDQAI